MNSGQVPVVDAGRIIKVNHAGEHGAVNIYAGQAGAMAEVASMPAATMQVITLAALISRHETRTTH